MIHYDLICALSHEFDGWFRDSAAFDQQASRGLIGCPECGDTKVSRALMAPALHRKGNSSRRQAARVEPVAAQAEIPAAVEAEPASMPVQATPSVPAMVPDQVKAVLQRMRAEVERHCDYVGDAFADEARRIKRGESDRRGIYGETTPEQAEALADEGIEVSRIPWVPRADG